MLLHTLSNEKILERPLEEPIFWVRNHSGNTFDQFNPILGIDFGSHFGQGGSVTFTYLACRVQLGRQVAPQAPQVPPRPPKKGAQDLKTMVRTPSIPPKVMGKTC